MEENKTCGICGGYIGNVMIRQLPAQNTDGVPYPEATVPPINVCPGHPEEKPMQTGGTLPADGVSPFIIMHEYDPSKELMYIPANASIFPNDYRQRQETLWKIVQRVAERESLFFEPEAEIEQWQCPFCTGGQTFHGYVRKEPFPHQPGCIVVKARELMEWRNAQPKITIQVHDDFSPAVRPIAEIARELVQKVKERNEEVPGD
jgi:hypothetical protein